MRIKHIISQIDGNNDSDENTSEETEIVPSQLDDLDRNGDKGTKKTQSRGDIQY